MAKVTQQALDQVRDTLGPELLEAVVQRELALRRETRNADRMEEREEAQAGKPRQPGYKEITSGVAKRKTAPVAMVKDRPFVPGALRWWRQAHNLSTREAQERIGYSVQSSIWKQWEQGFAAPPYLALLKIIASTGIDPRAAFRDPAAGGDPDLRLDMLRRKNEERRRKKRPKVAP